MNKAIGLQLVVYSLLLTSLSYWSYYMAPDLARPTLLIGLLGGVFCMIWGLRAMGGHGGKGLPILTLVLANFFLLSQTFMGWWGGGTEMPGRRISAILVTFLFLLSMGMLMRIAYAGMQLDGLPGRPKNEADPSPRNTPSSSKLGHGIKHS